jgi:hypothetical protein
MRALPCLLALILLAGCSASNGVTFGSGTSSGAGGTGGTGGSSSGSTTSGSSSSSSGIVFDAGSLSDAGTTGPAEVFGQSATTLYKLDPVTNAVTTVGDFQGCDTVIDIALDKDGNMFGTTFGGFFAIDKTTAACTHIADGSYPNSLSFVPKGTLDPNVEALVGYDTDNNYIRIDTTTGAISVIGAGILGDYASSGDIVSVIGGGTYLTVTGGPQGNCADCIVQVDPKTGAVMKNIGNLSYGAVFGLAFWGGSAYGFSENGPVFQIDLTNAHCTDIPIPNMPAGYPWYGAGSTTSAPLTMTM